MTPRLSQSHPASGNVLIATFFVVIVLAALVTSVFHRALSSNTATRQNEIEMKLLYVAESGINYHAVSLANDPLAIVKDTTTFAFDSAANEYVAAPQQISLSDDVRRTFQVRAQYLNGTTPVAFADRADPEAEWTTLRLQSTATLGTFSRSVAVFYRFVLGEAFASALISDAPPIKADGGSGKSYAQDGNISFDNSNGRQFVFGGMRANGTITSKDGFLTEENAAASLGGFSGVLEQGLHGTEDEIPDFTALGGSDQLFDFDRIAAVAANGGGTIYTTMDDFLADAELSTPASPLEGVIVLDIDTAHDNGDIEDCPNGVNIHGTLMFRFSNGTDPMHKVFIKSPLNINAADLSGFDPADESTYTTGYPPTYVDSSKRPWTVNIAPTYKNFNKQSDLPALMFNTGIVDVHDAANICGVVYGPSFIELENKSENVQYYNGAIIGGAGIYLQGNGGDAAAQAFRYDPETVGNLETKNNRGKSLVRVGYTILD